MCEVVKQLEGAYALLIKSSVYPGELVACRRGSPLILGMKYGIQVGARAGRRRDCTAAACLRVHASPRHAP